RPRGTPHEAHDKNKKWAEPAPEPPGPLVGPRGLAGGSGAFFPGRAGLRPAHGHRAGPRGRWTPPAVTANRKESNRSPRARRARTHRAAARKDGRFEGNAWTFLPPSSWMRLTLGVRHRRVNC